MQQQLASKLNQLQLESQEEKAFGLLLFFFLTARTHDILAKAIQKASIEFTDLLQSFALPAEAISCIHQKYISVFTDQKKLMREHAKLKKKLETVAKEREDIRAKYNTILSQKTKLENVARELQKDSRRIKEESQRLIQLEQAKRYGRHHFDYSIYLLQ